MSARALSLKLATSERFFPYNIYPMRTIEIKYAILYLLSRHLMNTIYSTITSVVTFYSPHIPKLSAYALNINRGRGTSMTEKSYMPQSARKYRQIQAILHVRDSVCMGSTSQNSTAGAHVTRKFLLRPPSHTPAATHC